MNGCGGQDNLSASKPLIITIICITGLALAILAGGANVAAHHQAARGVAQGFPAPLAYSDVPRLGVNAHLEDYDTATLSNTLKPLLSQELRWVRQTFPWAEIEATPGRLEWDRWNAVSEKLDKLGAPPVLAVLDEPPPWFQFSTSNLQSSTFAFAHFAGEFAKRYGGRVDYYQIWDEPNLGARWGGQAEPTAYADLLRQAGDAIRANDPGAVIVLAGLAPTVEQSSGNMPDWLFLRRLYEIGAQDYFDIAAGKPYGFYTGPGDRRVDANMLNFSHILLMREEMEKRGDAAKPLWATQWGWNALPQDWSGAPSAWGQATEAQQAEYTQQAIARAAQEWPWMTAMFLENFQPGAPADDPRWGFALVWQDGAPRLVYNALITSAAQMALPRPGYYAAVVKVKGIYVGNPTATFEGDWRFGELGADWQDESGATVSFDFDGTGLALRVRRAADRANLYVTIDGQPANALPRDGRGAFLQLIPPDFTQADVVTIPVARGLPPGRHHAQIVAERGWNQWALVGWSVENQITHTQYQISNWALAVLGALCLVGAVWSGQRVQWGRLGQAASRGYARLSQAAQIALTLLAGGLMYLGAWMTWGQEASAAFRRLGDGAGAAAMLGLGALFYFSPWLILTIVSGLALFVLILLRLDLGLALVVFLAPFFFLPRMLFERVFSMVEIVTLMCFASWLKYQIPNLKSLISNLQFPTFNLQSLISKLSSLDCAVFTFVAVAATSLFTAEYRHVALREFRVIVIEPALLYLMLRTTIKDRSAAWRVLDALALAGALVAIIGLIQYTFNINIITAEEGARRVRAVYGSPNNAALFLGRVLPVLVAVALLGPGRRRMWYALAILPVALSILLTFSKGALLLGVPASLAIVLLLWQGKRAWGWLAGLGAAGAAAFALLSRLPAISARLDLSGGTSVVRLNLWKSAAMMIAEHPILGVGLDNFLYQYRGRYLLPEAWVESFMSHPHNIVLDYAARLGLIGLAAGVWMHVAFWKTALPLRKLDRALAIGLMGSMTSMLAHGMVDASAFVIDLSYVFFVTLALIQTSTCNAAAAKPD